MKVAAAIPCIAIICATTAMAGCGARGATGARRPAAAANHPPSVRARCEPCRVEAGALSSVAVDASDPDGDPLTYRWSAASGTLASTAARQSAWTAPMQEGAVPVTVEVRDPHGGVATDAVTIQVVGPARRSDR